MNAIILVVLFVASDVNPPAFYAPNEELRTYLLEAGEKSPTLEVRHSEWRASLQRIPQVTALDDPMFTFGYFLQSEMNDYKVMLSQKFPWFGTLRTRGEKATLDADATLARFYNERNLVFSEVKKAYFEYGFLGDSIKVTESQIEVLEYMEDIVRSKFETGMAKEDELLRISIEKTKVKDRRDGFMQFKPALMSRLNETLGAEAAVDRPWPQKAKFPHELPSQDEIHAQIRIENPDIKRLDYLIESRGKQIKLAKKKGHPDFTLGLEYLDLDAANNPDDNAMFSFKVNLPIWRKKIKSSISEAKIRETSATFAKRRRTLELEEAAQMAIFTIEDAKRRYALFENTLTPQAQRSYESLQSQYATGDVGTSFIDVLDSIQTLLAFELEQIRAARDWQVGAANLEFLMGGPWGNPEGREDAPGKS